MTDITTEQIVEAGARTIYYESLGDTTHPADVEWALLSERERSIYRAMSQAALAAMLPLIRKQLADEVRGDCAPDVIGVHEGYGEEAWCPKHREHWPCGNEAAARLIEGVEG